MSIELSGERERDREDYQEVNPLYTTVPPSKGRSGSGDPPLPSPHRLSAFCMISCCYRYTNDTQVPSSQVAVVHEGVESVGAVEAVFGLVQRRVPAVGLARAHGPTGFEALLVARILGVHRVVLGLRVEPRVGTELLRAVRNSQFIRFTCVL